MLPLQMRKPAADEAQGSHNLATLGSGFDGRPPPQDRHPKLAEGPRSHQREEFDGYQTVVANLNAGWRVIECRHRIQWILQRRTGQRHRQPRSEGKQNLRTNDALLRVVHRSLGQMDEQALRILEALPERLNGFRIAATMRQCGAS